MILEIVKYGHPVLRKKGERIESITPEIKKLIADMFETMEANHGVGLAAQQVGVAKQLTVIDVRAITDRPSTLELDGKPADVAVIMPLVLINPVVTPAGEPATGGDDEGVEGIDEVAQVEDHGVDAQLLVGALHRGVDQSGAEVVERTALRAAASHGLAQRTTPTTMSAATKGRLKESTPMTA